MKNFSRPSLELFVHRITGILLGLVCKPAIQRFILVFFICLSLFAYRQNSLTVLAILTALIFFPTIATSSYIREAYQRDTKDPYDVDINVRTSLSLIVLFLSVVLLIVLGLNDHFWSPKEPSEIINDAIDQNIFEYLFFTGSAFTSFAFAEKNRWTAAKLILITGFVWVTFYSSAVALIKTLGADSFSEAHQFDLSEAAFWISTLHESIKPNIFTNVFLIYVAFTLFLFFALRYLFYATKLTRGWFTSSAFIIGISCIGFSIHMTASETISFFLKNSEKFLSIRQNFDNSVPVVKRHREGVNLVVYVGESTSVMNMGIYGYPRNTTPRLSDILKEDSGIIVFHNVFSTHTHTTDSLLEAFSIAADSENMFSPISARKRLSIVDLLNGAGIPVDLVSNQGMSGSWNLASSVVFRSANRTFGSDSRLLGNFDYQSVKPWDDELFMKHFETRLSPRESWPVVTFLHSYAGHGDYLRNIPPRFRSVVDNYYSANRFDKIRESGNSDISQIEAYDSAVRYIDFSVSKIIETVKISELPTVFIYLSDHGESVFTGLGHDSSRLMHEMLRIPFIMYFNNAARVQSQSLFWKYAALAKQRETSTLAQFSSTVLDLTGVSVEDDDKSKALITSVIGERTSLPPILVRELRDHISFINLNPDFFSVDNQLGKELIDATDTHTHDYVAAKFNKRKAQNLCQRKWSSFEQVRRYQLIVDC